MCQEVASEEYQALAEILPDDFSNPRDTVAEVRAKFDVVHGHDPGPGVTVSSDDVGVWVRADGDTAARATVFFVHGGGFVTSPAPTYAFYGANIVRHCGVDVVIPDYSLAPEAPFPAPLNDLLEAYAALLSEGVDPARVVFMGDSCGGGMALAALVKARDTELPLPAGFVGLSGWFDLEATGESAVRPIGRDPFLDPEWLRLRGRDYVGPGGDPSDPLASPLHADLKGLPPMLLEVGTIDRCRSDSERLAVRVADVQGSAQLDIWPGMPHGFQGLVGAVPEADAALARVAEFIAANVPQWSPG